MAEAFVNEEIKQMVRDLEGFSKKAYVDARGHSVGYGHHIQKGEEAFLTEGMSKEQAEKFLEADIKLQQSPWIGKLRKDASPEMIAALTSFSYNAGGFSSDLGRAISYINNGNTDAATKLMARYYNSFDAKVGGKVRNEVLVERRAFEAKLMKGEKISWGEFRKQYSKDQGTTFTRTIGDFGKKVVDSFKQLFGGGQSTKGPSFATATADVKDCMTSNAEVLQGLKELNADLGMQSAETRWLRRLKAEGSGLWAAQQ